MSLDLPQVLPQVEALGREAAQQAAARPARLRAAQAAWRSAAQQGREALRLRVARAPAGWRGAAPLDEPIDSVHDAPPHPPRLRVLGADGSQVYPDRHALAHYYLINIGLIDFDHGSGEAPHTRTQPILGYTADDLYDRFGGAVDPALINARRDLEELRALAGRAAEGPGPVVALIDNTLLLWAAQPERERNRPEIVALLQGYLEAMGRAQAAGAALAGFVDRPGSTHLLALLQLAAAGEQAGPAPADPDLYRGLTDRELLAGRLGPGQRSAVFELCGPLAQVYAEHHHALRFFYLHTGYEDLIARVELPAWVADDPQRLSWLHAGLIEQCRLTGVPYVLVRAHELALVARADRQALEGQIGAALRGHGLSPRISQKALTKTWTAVRRRHRL